ncbi:hypothetical protein MANES_18G079300v8 [Manihot esculenta]|uniref:Uncharacterized protein n=1 Tax=Manihot esculenta TaxID=3983 RepID=A0ACB7FYW5_MANES|nr:hypothetical protein MANES_18G079300v8 [Manihot esculenta]
MDPESIPPVDDSLSRSEKQHTTTSSTLLPKTQPKGFLGKHRMAAAISDLQSQINFLQEELDQLEELGEASIVCRETKGSTNISWDRWFTGAPNSCKR